jgi:nucleotide-binding universal stress UspA family protein
LATDGSEEAGLAARTAAALAEKIGSELHVVHVFGIIPWYPAYPDTTGFDGPEVEEPIFEEDLERSSEQRAKELLDAEVEKIRAFGGSLAQAHLTEGGVSQEIVALAEEIGVGLVVMGSRGQGGIRRALMGSVSESVVRHAHCPVMVVRGDGHEEEDFLPGRILLALDGSEEADAAARTAVELADRMDSELHVVYVGGIRPVYHPERHGYLARYAQLQEEAQRRLEEQVEDVKASGATVADAHLRMGRPDEEIVVLGEEIGAGLLVTGSRGLGGIRSALMVSTSASIVRHAHCPVLVVRPQKERASEHEADFPI